MTFDEWQKTATRTQDIADAVEAMGYEADGDFAGTVAEVVEHDPGIIVLLKDGTYYTAFDREEASGSLESVQRALWQGYARYEVDTNEEGESDDV